MKQSAEQKWRDRIRRQAVSGNAALQFCLDEGVSHTDFNEMRKRTSRPAVDFVPMKQLGKAAWESIIGKHPGKRGVINSNDPPALRKLGLDMDHWAMQVKGIGSGYWRAVGTVEDLMAKAAEIGQNWLCGIGFARFFKS